eukprot:scaffold1941_cov263-Pinguiococcus_pyrenoidosus.AAC.14
MCDSASSPSATFSDASRAFGLRRWPPQASFACGRQIYCMYIEFEEQDIYASQCSALALLRIPDPVGKLGGSTALTTSAVALLRLPLERSACGHRQGRREDDSEACSCVRHRVFLFTSTFSFTSTCGLDAAPKRH